MKNLDFILKCNVVITRGLTDEKLCKACFGPPDV